MGGGEEGPPEVATQVLEEGTQGWREHRRPKMVLDDDQDPFEGVDFGVPTDDDDNRRPEERGQQGEEQQQAKEAQPEGRAQEAGG